MSEQPVETPKEELECKKKYLYEYSMFWECKEHSKNQILEEDVCDLLNKFSSEIEELGISIALFEDDVQVKDKKIGEQQATIEHLTKSRDKWRELSNSFLFYCKCYEKAIERAFEEKPCPSEEDINRIYEELEKELENE